MQNKYFGTPLSSSKKSHATRFLQGVLSAQASPLRGYIKSPQYTPSYSSGSESDDSPNPAIKLVFSEISETFKEEEQKVLAKLLANILENLDPIESPDALGEAVQHASTNSINLSNTPFEQSDLSVIFSVQQKNIFIKFANIILNNVSPENEIINLTIFFAQQNNLKISIDEIKGSKLNFDNFDTPIKEDNNFLYSSLAFTCIGIALGATAMYCAINKDALLKMGCELFKASKDNILNLVRS